MPDLKPGTFNANTVIMSLSSVITLAVLGWIGAKSSSNNDSLTEIKAQLPYLNQAVTDLKAQIGALVSRAELDSRVAEMSAKQLAIEKRVLVLEIETRHAGTGKGAGKTAADE